MLGMEVMRTYSPFPVSFWLPMCDVGHSSTSLSAVKFLHLINFFSLVLVCFKLDQKSDEADLGRTGGTWAGGYSHQSNCKRKPSKEQSTLN